MQLRWTADKNELFVRLRGGSANVGEVRGGIAVDHSQDTYTLFYEWAGASGEVCRDQLAQVLELRVIGPFDDLGRRPRLNIGDPDSATAWFTQIPLFLDWDYRWETPQVWSGEVYSRNDPKSVLIEYRAPIETSCMDFVAWTLFRADEEALMHPYLSWPTRHPADCVSTAQDHALTVQEFGSRFPFSFARILSRNGGSLEYIDITGNW